MRGQTLAGCYEHIIQLTSRIGTQAIATSRALLIAYEVQGQYIMMNTETKVLMTIRAPTVRTFSPTKAQTAHRHGEVRQDRFKLLECGSLELGALAATAGQSPGRVPQHVENRRFDGEW